MTVRRTPLVSYKSPGSCSDKLGAVDDEGRFGHPRDRVQRTDRAAVLAIEWPRRTARPEAATRVEAVSVDESTTLSEAQSTRGQPFGPVLSAIAQTSAVAAQPPARSRRLVDELARRWCRAKPRATRRQCFPATAPRRQKPAHRGEAVRAARRNRTEQPLLVVCQEHDLGWSTC